MNPDWRDFAHCKGMDPNTFYPTSHEVQKMRDAIEICRQCLVRPDCLEDALTSGWLCDNYGIRGGETESGRRRLIRSRKVAV